MSVEIVGATCVWCHRTCTLTDPLDDGRCQSCRAKVPTLPAYCPRCSQESVTVHFNPDGTQRHVRGSIHKRPIRLVSAGKLVKCPKCHLHIEPATLSRETLGQRTVIALFQIAVMVILFALTILVLAKMQQAFWP